ncbi:TetR/AcrR family transcriptional regulator [Nocardioides sp. NBC_00850]|uniref:TetR/AcrR family transcriptional regulator n=1 Tax=Nocardioides sp. NBC_00850 TaxID=2976001 RepID=UPI0038666320|nr:TetR/AcrR family transcriptional regulator [Nocardioides sp. NBC_00850]
MSEPRWRRLGADQRREEIFACAQRLFTQRPYAEVSTTDIAREAGVARGLLNHYFGTKRDLYLEVVREAATVPEIAVAQLPNGTLAERIDAAVTWFLDSLDQQGASWINATGSHGMGRDPELEKILVQAENDSVDRLIEAIGVSETEGRRDELRAFIRTYGQLARAAGREWLVKKALTREQVHQLLTVCLLAIVDDVLPASLDH